MKCLRFPLLGPVSFYFSYCAVHINLWFAACLFYFFTNSLCVSSLPLQPPFTLKACFLLALWAYSSQLFGWLCEIRMTPCWLSQGFTHISLKMSQSSLHHSIFCKFCWRLEIEIRVLLQLYILPSFPSNTDLWLLLIWWLIGLDRWLHWHL